MPQRYFVNYATSFQIGPFLSSTDGYTERTALALTATDVFLSKNGETFAAVTVTATLPGGALGWYTMPMATTELNTIGPLRLYTHPAAATTLPVWHDYEVVNGVRSSVSTATAAASTTTFVSTLPSTTNNYYNEQTLTFISGSLLGQSRVIYDYDGTTKVLTFDEAWTGTPTQGSVFEITPHHNHSITQISDFAAISVPVGVWNKARSATFATGSFGEYVIANAKYVATQTPETATSIAQAVRDIVLVTGTATSLGYAISEISRLTATYLDASISSRSNLSAANITTAASDAINNNLGAIAANVMGYEGADITDVPTATAAMYKKIDFMYAQSVGQRTADRSASMERLLNLGGTATIASAAFSDDGTAFTRSRWGTAT